MEKYLKFSATILQNENMDAAYVEVPYDIKELFGKGTPARKRHLRRCSIPGTGGKNGHALLHHRRYQTDSQTDRQELWRCGRSGNS